MARQIPQRTRAIALIGALTLFVAALMLCLDGTRDGDLYLQLASGRYIATHGLVSVDPFQTIAHGEPWLNQQWLSELLAYRVSLLLGVTGLTVGYAALLAAPLGLLLWLCRRKGLGMMIALAVELDGWLGHFSAAELRDTYAVLDGRVADPMPYVRRLRIGAAIVDRHRAIRSLREHGFRVEFHTAAGTYLVKRVDRRSGPQSSRSSATRARGREGRPTRMR